jgi:DNA polymerase phi
LEEAHKLEGARVLNEIEPNDLASYFTRFVETVSSIPSVSLFRALGDEDDKAFKKLLKMERKLSNEVIPLPLSPLPPSLSLVLSQFTMIF